MGSAPAPPNCPGSEGLLWNIWAEDLEIPEECTPNGQPIVVEAVELADIPIHRLRFSIRTCDKKYAGTTHAAWIRINGIRMFLDRPGKDRKRNKKAFYSMKLSPANMSDGHPISTIGDIQDITIGKTYYPGKKDDWCIAQFQIKLNNSKFFFFKRKWPRGAWLNNKRRKLRINNSEITSFYRYNRASFHHLRLYGQLPRVRLKPTTNFLSIGKSAVLYFEGKVFYSNYILREMMMSFAGDMLHSRNNYSPIPKKYRKRLKWGKKKGRRFVEIRRPGIYSILAPSIWPFLPSSDMYYVDFDFKQSVPGPDPAVNMGFSFKVISSGGNSVATRQDWSVKGETIDKHGKVKYLGIPVTSLVDWISGGEFNKALEALNINFTLQFPTTWEDLQSGSDDDPETPDLIHDGFQRPKTKLTGHFEPGLLLHWREEEVATQ